MKYLKRIEYNRIIEYEYVYTMCKISDDIRQYFEIYSITICNLIKEHDKI